MNRRHLVTALLATPLLATSLLSDAAVVSHEWESKYLDYNRQHATTVTIRFADGTKFRQAAKHYGNDAHLFDEKTMIRGEKLVLRFWAKNKYGVYLDD